MTKIVMLNKLYMIRDFVGEIPKTNEEVNKEIELLEKDGFFLSETFDPISVLIFTKDIGE